MTEEKKNVRDLAGLSLTDALTEALSAWYDANPECEKEEPEADAVPRLVTALFSLPEAGPTIEQIKSDIPGLVIIAQVGKSYGALIPNNYESLGKFQQLYDNVPEAAPEDKSALEQEVRERLFRP